MIIRTKNPIAVTSNDHLRPHGTIHDFSESYQFCTYVLERWPGKRKLLDLGTGTGTVVDTAVKAGMDAYGVEGSDAPRKQKLGGWPKMADTRLFNADLRYYFALGTERDVWIDEPYGPTEVRFYPEAFDVITAWDVMEHMTEDTIDTVMENIRRHSQEGTFVMATIQFDSHNNELYHHLLKPREWWIKKFAEYGFVDKGFSPMLQLVRAVPTQNTFWFEYR